MAAKVPHLRAERALWRQGKLRVVGVDEVGMGALCAPVFAAAVLVRPNCHKIRGVRDSKTLSPKQREAVVHAIKQRVVAWGVGAASVDEIERLNIYHASHLAMRRALARIDGYDHVLVDGRKIVGFEDRVGPYTSIVDGDASSYAIACASIVAKVCRDRLMAQLATRYPGYGWEHNAGYTTRDHVAALGELGLTPHHRRTYQRIRAILEGDQMELDLLGEDAGGSAGGSVGGGVGTSVGATMSEDQGEDAWTLVSEGQGADRSPVAIPIEAGRPIEDSSSDLLELGDTPELVASRPPAA